MDIKELRIGNLVYFECDNLHMTTRSRINYIKQDGIYKGGEFIGLPIYIIGIIDQWEQQREEHIIDLEPIELNSDILIKCGFYNGEYHENWYYHTELNMHIVVLDDCCRMEGVDDIILSKPFKYLHQLQNLFYCLTGKELEIKL